MRHLLLLITIAICLTSCKSEYALLQDDLKQTNGARLHFYRPGTKDFMSTAEIMPGDTAELLFLEKVITKRNTRQTKCGPDGKIVFFKDGNIILETEFQMQPECGNISFVYRNRLYYKKLSPDAVTYLNNQHKDLMERLKQYEK